MLRIIEAIIDVQGNVHLQEPVALPAPRWALVTILEEASAIQVPETALLSEPALAVETLDKLPTNSSALLLKWKTNMGRPSSLGLCQSMKTDRYNPFQLSVHLAVSGVLNDAADVVP